MSLIYLTSLARLCFQHRRALAEKENPGREEARAGRKCDLTDLLGKRNQEASLGAQFWTFGSAGD